MIIANDLRGIVYKNDEYERMLMPGRHMVPPGRRVETFNVFNVFAPRKDLSLYLHDPRLLSELHVVDVKDNEIAIRFERGLFKEILPPGRHAFWKAFQEHSFLVIDLSRPEIDPSFNKALLLKPDFMKHIYAFAVESHERGLLFFNRDFQRLLEPGDYYFWKGMTPVHVLKADMRQLQLDMNGQEIMTRDKIALRINFVCQYRIINPLAALHTVKNHEEQLYISLQLALREFVGSYTLDEILEKKQSMSAHVLESMKGAAAAMGLELLGAGVKDVILPGDVRDIINQVLIAEKKAQANVIMRREETASTRSLLNTARLMDENKTLSRLKELEYIERISEKIHSISLSTGGQFIEQLRQAFQPLPEPRKE